MDDKTSVNDVSPPQEESSTTTTASTIAVIMQPPPAVVISITGVKPPPPSQPQEQDTIATSDVTDSITDDVAGWEANAALKKMPSLAATTADASVAFSTVPSTSPSLGNFGNSSGSESEHLVTTSISTSTATSAPSLPSSITSSNNDNTTTVDNNIRSLSRLRSKTTPSQWKAPSQSCISRPSSLSSKSRGSSKPHHAYFASSEEESEAELDEKDSHSSHNKYIHQHHPMGRGLTSDSRKSSLRGRGKLAEIASKVAHSQPISLHSSRVRMTIPQNHHDATTSHHMASSSGHKESGSNKKPMASIYKTTASGRDGAAPPPPQTVTVAVGKSSISDGLKATNALPSPGSTSSSPHHPLQPPSTVSSMLRRKATAAAAAHVNLPYTSPTRKRLRKKGRRHKHLPQGLPAFKDPRSCMWTSTHDANAPSEDRYSSLVNVLLRPPKTLRDSSKKGNQNKNNNNNGSTNGNLNRVGVGDGCSGGDKENSSADLQQKKQAAASAEANNSTATLPANNNNNDDESDEDEDEDENTSLIRLSLWSVIDGHGGGCVATYAAEVLLPHIAASVARALKSEIVDRGVCNVNGQLRDANALDLDGLIRSSDRSRHVGKSQVRQREAGIDVVNPNSIHYRSPFEDSESEGDVGIDHVSRGTQGSTTLHHHHLGDSGMRSESESEAESEAGRTGISVASSLLPGRNHPITHNTESLASSVKTSIKTAVSPVTQHAPVGTHSPAEVASLTRAITDSFLAVDEGWINSIDPVMTHQSSCVSNGRWNAGACALVVFTVQRLDWCRSSRMVDHETPHREHCASGLGPYFEDTSHNKDAARRRKLDYATKKCKSVSSMSTMSSTSSITTEANTTEMLVEESEITETEDDDDDVSDIFAQRTRRRRKKGLGHHRHLDDIDDPHHSDGDGYLPHDAMLYTAHVGDCRAVMLGSAPPRTIKVPPDRSRMGMHDDDDNERSLSLDHSDRSEDELLSETSSNTSRSVADEISSSEHDSDSSRDMEEDRENRGGHFLGSRRGGPAPGSAANPGGTMLGYARRSKRQRRNAEKKAMEQPFVPLPPLNHWSSEESAVESDDSMSTTAQDDHLPPVGSIRTTPHTAVGRGVVGGVGSELLDMEDEIEVASEEEDEIKEIRSVRSASPTQMDRPPSPTQLVADPVHPPPLPLSMLMRPIDLTTDHSAYNPAEVTAVLRRCNNAPRAISSASSGGIKRVAGSLAVTRALGDAYLKTPRLSFFPYKRHAPYITARPEVNCRILTKGADRILTLASDGVWERASGDDVLRWVRNYYNARIAGVKEQHLQYDNNHNIGEEQHAQYNAYGGDVGAVAEKSLSRRKHGGGGSDSGSGRSGRLDTTTGKGKVELGDSNNATAVGSSGKICSEKVPDEKGEMTNLTPPADNTTEKPSHDATMNAAAAHDASKIHAATTAPFDENATTAATTKSAGTKRKHSTVDETSVSSHSASSTTASARGGGRGGGGGGSGGGTTASSSRGGGGLHHHAHHHNHHLRSSSRSLAIPTVSEVIVRKVLNKVRKTRNISSLRMLMSLPKGRARRSKHDDITASVVDLSGFIS